MEIPLQIAFVKRLDEVEIVAFQGLVIFRQAGFQRFVLEYLPARRHALPPLADLVARVQQQRGDNQETDERGAQAARTFAFLRRGGRGCGHARRLAFQGFLFQRVFAPLQFPFLFQQLPLPFFKGRVGGLGFRKDTIFRNVFAEAGIGGDDAAGIVVNHIRDFARIGKPFIGVFFQAFVNDVAPVGFLDQENLFLGGAARKHFQQYQSEGIQVGPAIHARRVGLLFGGGVFLGSHKRGSPNVGIVVGGGQAEIYQLHIVAPVGDHDVVGLEVAVIDLLFVGIFQGFQKLAGNFAHQLFVLDATRRNALRERPAIHVFHEEKRPFGIFAAPQHIHNVFVLQGAAIIVLFEKQVFIRRIAAVFGWQPLHHHPLAVVAGFLHQAHGTLLAQRLKVGEIGGETDARTAAGRIRLRSGGRRVSGDETGAFRFAERNGLRQNSIFGNDETRIEFGQIVRLRGVSGGHHGLQHPFQFAGGNAVFIGFGQQKLLFGSGDFAVADDFVNQ